MKQYQVSRLALFHRTLANFQLALLWAGWLHSSGMNSKSVSRRASLSKPSRGLGDTIAKITHATYLDALVGVYSEFTGRPCNCDQRQDALNRLVPYRRRKHRVLHRSSH